MATERIDIVVTERGTRTVRRNIESLATAAERADSEFNALKSAISRIAPTQQLNTLLQQLNGVRDSLAGSRSMKNWMKISIEDANRAIVELSANLRSIRTSMAGTTDWAAIAEFRQAEETLEDIIAKLQRIRSMQNLNVNSAAGLRSTGGVAPHIPQVVTLPETNRFAREAELAARNAERLGSGIDRVGNAARGAHTPFLLLNRYVGAFGSIMIGQQLMQLADSATVVSNRVAIVSDSMGEAAAGVKALYGIARRTRTPIEEMSQLYQKVMMASEELGISQQDAFRFVEAVGMGLAVQGSSANTARGALIQLSQAIGTDIVRAEEFNSILEGAYPIALAAARGIDEAGGSVAKLRRMVIDGEISSREFFEAIMSQYPEIAGMFSKTTPTISQSFTVLRNALTEYIDQSEEAKIISEAVSGAIILIADNIEPLADVLFSLGAAWAVAFTLGKIGAVARMATSTGALATSMTLLRGAMGFLGGPIVGGLTLLAGVAFWVYQNMDSAADQIERLNKAMDDGVTALQSYNQWVQTAATEQEALGGNINLTTEAMLRQTRAQLQDALAALQSEIADMTKDIEGGFFNVDEIQDTFSRFASSFARLDFELGKLVWNNETAQRFADMLMGLKDGTTELSAFVLEANRLRGIGPETAEALEQFNLAREALDGMDADTQSQLWMSQAVEQLSLLAELIGGFDKEVAGLENFSPVNPDQVSLADELAAKLQEALEVSETLRANSSITDTLSMLEALSKAREQERLMLEALGANAQRLNELVGEAERLRVPMEGSAGAAEDTEAALDRINFTPLEDGARGFADELIRAAAAIELIRGRSNSVTLPEGNNRQPQLINAAYNPNEGGSMAFMSTSGSSGGLDDATYGAMLSALAAYGVPTPNTTLSAMGGGAANSNFRPGVDASTGIMGAYDRTGQSEEYLRVIRSINSELETQYQQLTLNTQAAQTEQIVADATAEARREGIILSQQDIALIRQRAEALSEMETKLELIQDVSNAVFSNLSSSLDSFVRTGKFSFSELAVSVIADMAKIGMQTFLLGPLQNWFQGLLGGFMGVGGAGLPAYNEGADFVVGGRGGVDQNVVAFKASRGERVTVTPAGKDGSNGQVTNNFYITTPDVQGFRQSEAQIAARMQRALGRGQRNM